MTVNNSAPSHPAGRLASTTCLGVSASDTTPNHVHSVARRVCKKEEIPGGDHCAHQYRTVLSHSSSDFIRVKQFRFVHAPGHDLFPDGETTEQGQ